MTLKEALNGLETTVLSMIKDKLEDNRQILNELYMQHNELNEYCKTMVTALEVENEKLIALRGEIERGKK